MHNTIPQEPKIRARRRAYHPAPPPDYYPGGYGYHPLDDQSDQSAALFLSEARTRRLVR
jgi:hypothetical protein